MRKDNSSQKHQKPTPKDAELWDRFKNFVLVLDYTLGRFIEVSKVNLVKAAVFSYHNGHFMYVLKNLGKAGIVPLDILLAIDELIEEGRLERRKAKRTLKRKNSLGGIEFVETEIEELVASVETQTNIQQIFSELHHPVNLLERNGYWVGMNLLKSKNTTVQGNLSIERLTSRLSREKNMEHHTFHKYATYWDVDKKLTVGVDKIVVGELLDVPYPRPMRIPQDPIKRNVKLAMEILRKKKDVGAEHLWVSTIKSDFDKDKDRTIGTVVLLVGFPCGPLKFDSVSKMHTTNLSISSYLLGSNLQIPIILDADVESTAFYFTTLDDFYSYEYLVVGSITEHHGKSAIRCYGLIAIDDLPDTIKSIWCLDTFAMHLSKD
ncbi:MAG: hypothetical protein OEY88_04260 [Candidatus Bathyarchaeota archaeon]|nr:hypothetical protein [Candidatus Bathyarchaeota archaeon]